MKWLSISIKKKKKTSATKDKPWNLHTFSVLWAWPRRRGDTSTDNDLPLPLKYRPTTNTWWWGVILFDQITGEDGHWGALLLRDLLRLLLLCSFVNKVLHSVDLFNSHLCRMWYLNWMDYYCYREAEDDIRQSENVGGNNQYRDKVVNCNWSISFSLLINININT